MACVGEPLPVCPNGAAMPLKHCDLRPAALQQPCLTSLSAFLQAGMAGGPPSSKLRCRSVDFTRQGAGSTLQALAERHVRGRGSNGR